MDQGADEQSFLAASEQALSAAGTEDLAASFGLSNAPDQVDGRELEVLGQASGYIEDAQGNVLGQHSSQPEGVIFQTIPGGIYQSIADTQAFFLNEEGAYSARIKVTGDDGVRLRDYASDAMNGQAVFEIEASQGAELRLELASNRSLQDLELAIDEDGDGVAERTVAPFSVATGEVASETDAPETAASARAVGGGRYEVSFSADDGSGGSGTAATRYYVEGELREQTYSGPFTVADGTTVYFYSVDKAGNTERPQRIDVTPPDTTVSSGPSGPVNSGSVAFTFSSDREDATFECALDGGTFEPCALPENYTDLPDGAHVFRARGRDAGRAGLPCGHLRAEDHCRHQARRSQATPRRR